MLPTFWLKLQSKNDINHTMIISHRFHIRRLILPFLLTSVLILLLTYLLLYAEPPFDSNSMQNPAMDSSEFTSDDNYTLCHSQDSKHDTKKLFLITPTYSRPEQMAELTRLAQTLESDTKVRKHWIVIEDLDGYCSESVTRLLQRHFPERQKQAKKVYRKFCAAY